MLRWEIKGSNRKTQSTKLNEDTIIAQLLENRGLTQASAVRDFLNPQLSTLHSQTSEILDPEELTKSTQRILEAIRNNEPIIIHGDYDVDGLCGTAILWEAIYYKLGYPNIQPFIPHRITHGYGVSQKSLDEIRHTLKNSPRALIITTDCGINALAEIKYARKLGFDVIITDHHAQPGTPPEAVAILHTYHLAGAGIAWILAERLMSELDRPKVTGTRPASKTTEPRKKTHLPTLKSANSLELVALATIADLQPLLGVNRSLVKIGLEKLNQTRRTGLKALLKVVGLDNHKIGSYEVSWMISPRLNALGRLEHALDSLRLLCTMSSTQAERLSEKLNEVNRERQRLTEKSIQQAQELLAQKGPGKIMVLDHPEWHEGIIGLIAAHLTETCYRPTIVIARGKKISKGSARSVKGFNITRAIQSCQDCLIEAGGHEMASGFRIETRRIKEFSEKITQTSESILTEGLPTPSLKIDLELTPEEVSWSLLMRLKQLEPHGIGNPKPTFVSRNTTIQEIRTVGPNREHLKLNLDHLSAIGFRLGHFAQQLKAGGEIDIAYTIEEDTWNGREALQLKLKDLCPTSE